RTRTGSPPRSGGARRASRRLARRIRRISGTGSLPVAAVLRGVGPKARVSSERSDTLLRSEKIAALLLVRPEYRPKVVEYHDHGQAARATMAALHASSKS